MNAYDKGFTISGVRRTRSLGIRKDNNFSCPKDKLFGHGLKALI